MRKIDPLEEMIEEIINKAGEPLETTEILEGLQKQGDDSTRSKVLYRLNNLRAEGGIAGKTVGSGKGTWIWYLTLKSLNQNEEK